MAGLEEKRLQNKGAGPVSWFIFLLTLSIVIISLVPVVFPSLVIISQGGFINYTNTNPYELGAFAIPFFVANFSLLGIAILYKKKQLPDVFTSAIHFIFNFEVSLKIALLVMAVLIGIFTFLYLGNIVSPEESFDFVRLKPLLDNYTLTDYAKGVTGYGPTVMFGLLSASDKIFGNYKIIPFVSNMALLVVTYMITTLITKKRFAGLVSFVLVMQSGIFYLYSTVPEYPSFWILFYLLSLYVIYIKWPLSPFAFYLSVMSKGLSAVFFPMTMFFIYRSDIPKRKKLYSLLLYGIIAAVAIAAIAIAPEKVVGTALRFNPHNFWMGFTAFVMETRFDPIILYFLLPLILGLFVAMRRGVRHADSIMVLILGVLIFAPVLSATTGQQNQPYRFITMSVFFAMGVGLMLYKRQSSNPHKSP